MWKGREGGHEGGREGEREGERTGGREKGREREKEEEGGIERERESKCVKACTSTWRAHSHSTKSASVELVDPLASSTTRHLEPREISTSHLPYVRGEPT